MKTSYPFVPRSNAHLVPGQFWGIRRLDGRWACGRVLMNRAPYAPNGRMSFLAGLMDWVGDAEPSGDDLAGAAVADSGWAHIKTIRERDGRILGHRDLGLDGIGAPVWVTAGGGGGWVYNGLTPVRPATRADTQALPCIGTYGLEFICLLADRLPG